MFPDVVVIGGGIIGCSCAYYLSLAGVSVHLVEMSALASGASGAGEGGIAPPERPGIQAEMARVSGALYRILAEELPQDIEYRKKGTLYVAETEEDWQSAAESCAVMRDEGEHCRLLTPMDTRELEPGLVDRVFGAAFYPDGAQVNPQLTALAMARAAKDHGAVVQTQTEVISIGLGTNGKAVTAVNTTSGCIPTGAVVNAAGASSRAVGKMVGIEVPVVPRKGHIVVTEPVPPIINCTTVSEVGYVRAALSAGDKVSIALEMEQTSAGNLLLGMSREFVGFDRSVNPDVVGAIVSRNLHFFPGNRRIHAIRVYAGLRPHSPDNLPIISIADEIGGFYVASGHEGEGVTMAPITGKLISQMITGQKTDVALNELSLSRFSRRA